MKIKLIKGVVIAGLGPCVKGLEYDVPESIGEYLIKREKAEAVQIQTAKPEPKEEAKKVISKPSVSKKAKSKAKKKVSSKSKGE